MIKYTKTINGFEPYIFQQDSINKVLNFINQCNGACIFDQTGLGKTIISATVALNSDVKKLLVVTTSALKKEWSEVLNLTNIEYEICTHKKIPQGEFDFVIVDEAHNFKEQNSKGYLELFTVIKQNYSKVLLLTATPFQNNLNQLKTMLSLISFHANSLPFISLGLLFDKMDISVKKMLSAEIKMERQTFGNPTEYMKAFHELQSDLKILSQIVATFSTRMTRKKIVEDFPSSIELIGNFPELKHTIKGYDIDFTGSFLHTCNILTSMAFSRQNIEVYKFENQNKNIKTSMRGLMRSLLLKRLDSSVHAFKTTLHSMYESLLELDKFIGLNTFVYEGEEINVIDRFWTDYSSDKKHFEILITLWKNHNDNIKLDLLFSELENTNTKVIVFTEYIDTLELIHNEAEKRGLKKFISFSGNNSEKDLEKINLNFNANQENVLNNLQYLFATDKLAEGVNLHASKKLIHFDQKWNPSKIVQRNGRVDRILKQSKSTSVEIVTFEVAKLVEEILELEKTIDKKIFLSDFFIYHLKPLDLQFLPQFESGKRYLIKSEQKNIPLEDAYFVKTSIGVVGYVRSFLSKNNNDFFIPIDCNNYTEIGYLNEKPNITFHYPLKNLHYSNVDYSFSIETLNGLYYKAYENLKESKLKETNDKKESFNFIMSIAPKHKNLVECCEIHFNEPKYVNMIEVGQK